MCFGEPEPHICAIYNYVACKYVDEIHLKYD